MIANRQRRIKTNSDLDHINRRVRRPEVLKWNPKTVARWFPRVEFGVRDWVCGWKWGQRR